MKSIFVGNLSFSTTQEELKELFSAHGAVQRISIMMDRDTGRSRGFAFVEMNDDAEAEAAIAALNGSSLGGRSLNINAARPRPERGAGGFGGSRDGNSDGGRPSGGGGRPSGGGGRRDAGGGRDDYQGHARQPREPRW
ncbi:MAG: RNA recognition motif domain-containing protein [Terriglobales bacterium]